MFSQATKKDIDTAMQTAKEYPDGCRKLDIDDRNKILSKVAMEIRNNRDNLIGSVLLKQLIL